ncbi:hypothetical protein FQ087_13170 [Sporosarcina sp. ANT_H38]|nr:hypothetical protein FQ087_13170 [Sporosarcina sp. ANT_H38]
MTLRGVMDIRKSPTTKGNLLSYYRYISLAVVSVFFLLNPQFIKAGVVVALAVVAWIIIDAQRKYLWNNKVLQSILDTQQDELLHIKKELSETMLERAHLDQLIIIEEQNRIANEIHDRISQRLFGIVYSLHSLQAKSRTMTNDELNDEYQFLSQSANTTLKELRAAIYRLSSLKKGEEPFIHLLKKYLDEYSRLVDVQIDHQITGDEAWMSDALKQALYRVISEACGNAVRHGQCTVIELRLSLLQEKIVMEIQDNGIGINVHKYDGQKEIGIGLSNIQNTVNSFKGTFSIEGIPGFGTAMRVEIPNLTIRKKEEAVV